MTEDSLPFVSVIVPVYNDPTGISRCLDALRSQTYSNDQFEVLVVDNGSTDDTREAIQEFDVKLLIEDEVQGSYAARNRGIENAAGSVLAFTDADCTPDPNWIEAGVETLQAEDADLVGGRVVFEFSEQKTAAERFDASVNMRNDKSVRDGVAKTANVFVRRTVVDDVGLFPSHLPSGGDVHWTQTATDSGYRLVYGEQAIVHHPSRGLAELLRKQYRVGTGQIQIWRLHEQSAAWILLVGAVTFPMKVGRFLLDTDDTEQTDQEIPPDRGIEKDVNVAAVAGLCIVMMNLGRIAGLFQRD